MPNELPLSYATLGNSVINSITLTFDRKNFPVHLDEQTPVMINPGNSFTFEEAGYPGLQLEWNGVGVAMNDTASPAWHSITELPGFYYCLPASPLVRPLLLQVVVEGGPGATEIGVVIVGTTDPMKLKKTRKRK